MSTLTVKGLPGLFDGTSISPNLLCRGSEYNIYVIDGTTLVVWHHLLRADNEPKGGPYSLGCIIAQLSIGPCLCAEMQLTEETATAEQCTAIITEIKRLGITCRGY